MTNDIDCSAEVFQADVPVYSAKNVGAPSNNVSLIAILV